jgi:hypothetical protein
MALVRDRSKLAEHWDPAFDREYRAGAPSPHGGIYRCTDCGHEIALPEGQALPGPMHPRHPPLSRSPIWRLVVAAEANAAGKE